MRPTWRDARFTQNLPVGIRCCGRASVGHFDGDGHDTPLVDAAGGGAGGFVTRRTKIVNAGTSRRLSET